MQMHQTRMYYKCSECGDVSRQRRCPSCTSGSRKTAQQKRGSLHFLLELFINHQIVVLAVIGLFTIQFVLILTILGQSFWIYEMFYNILLELMWFLSLYQLVKVYLRKYRGFQAWLLKWRPEFALRLIRSKYRGDAVFWIFERCIPVTFILLVLIGNFAPYFTYYNSPVTYCYTIFGNWEIIATPGLLGTHWIFGTILHLVVFFLSAASFFFIIFFLDFAHKAKKMAREMNLSTIEFEYVHLRHFFSLKRSIFIRCAILQGMIATLALVYGFILHMPLNAFFYGLNTSIFTIFPAILVIKHKGFEDVHFSKDLAMNVILIALGSRNNSGFHHYRFYRSGVYNEGDFFFVYHDLIKNERRRDGNIDSTFIFYLDNEEFHVLQISHPLYPDLFLLVFSKSMLRSVDRNKISLIFSDFGAREHQPSASTLDTSNYGLLSSLFQEIHEKFHLYLAENYCAREKIKDIGVIVPGKEDELEGEIFDILSSKHKIPLNYRDFSGGDS